MKKAALVVVLCGLCLAPDSWARIMRNTIDAVATLGPRGRSVIVTGPIACDEQQQVDLRVTVTQRTGAVAEGFATFICTAEEQQWTVEAAVQGRRALEAGDALVVALAISRVRGETDDAHQWLVQVTLVEE
jgi:hypothetical protein